ncbi:unnamed protein product, partial [Didymodactylos carnosus]
EDQSKLPKVVHKTRRDQSEISPLIKYLMFGFNIIFWILGFLIAAIGVYAWVEKETFQNFGRLTMGGALFFDPALLFILVGVTMFCIGFAGCLGALRENTCLLLFFSFALAIIFFAQLAFGTLIFIYRDKVKNEAEKQLLVMITSYRDDPDLQNMIDWIQRDWLHCCGVNSYRNWESNVYFNCSSKAVGSVEACGVPSSCCRPDYFHNNKQCGYGTLEPSAATHMIYTEGCVLQGSQWFERHILPVAIFVVVLAVLQIFKSLYSEKMDYVNKAADAAKAGLGVAGELIQKAAHSVSEVLTGDTNEKKDDVAQAEEKNQKSTEKKDGDSDDKGSDKHGEEIKSRSREFKETEDKKLESTTHVQQSGYNDKPVAIPVKTLKTSWPELVGKSSDDATKALKENGTFDIKIYKKGTSSASDHVENRVRLITDENGIVVEEPKVG